MSIVCGGSFARWFSKKRMTSDEQIACAFVDFWLVGTWVRCEDVIMSDLGWRDLFLTSRPNTHWLLTHFPWNGVLIFGFYLDDSLFLHFILSLFSVTSALMYLTSWNKKAYIIWTIMSYHIVHSHTCSHWSETYVNLKDTSLWEMNGTPSWIVLQGVSPPNETWWWASWSVFRRTRQILETQ